MADPAYIVFSAADVVGVGMKASNNVWTGANSFTSLVSVTGPFYANTGNFASLVSISSLSVNTLFAPSLATIGKLEVFGPATFASTVSFAGQTQFSNTARFGNASSYVQFTNAGDLSLSGDATVWEDLRVPVTSTKLGGSKDPGFSVFKTNGSGSQGTFVHWFDKDTEEELYFAVQMPHDWKLESTIYPHVHWVPKSSSTLTTVDWGLEYSWAKIGESFGNTTIISGCTVYGSMATVTADWHYMTSLGTMSGTGKTLSSMIVCRLFRDATDATNDTYNDDAGLLEIDFHYEIDSMGSRQEGTK